MRWFVVGIAVLVAGCRADTPSFGNATRGRELVERYRCQACHEIPGVAPIAGASAPSLDGIARREVVAGTIANTPANLIAYLEKPRIAKPSNRMPDLELPPEDARDLAAFLMTLR